MRTPTLSSLRDLATSWNASADRELEKFSAKLKENPAYALSWGGGAFDAAGRKEVACILLRWLDGREEVPEADRRSEEETVKNVTEYALKEVLRAAALGTSRSSSPTSNLMEDAKGAAWTVLYEELTSGW